MNRRATSESGRMPQAPARSLLALALLVASPAWAHEAADAAAVGEGPSPVASPASPGAGAAVDVDATPSDAVDTSTAAPTAAGDVPPVATAPTPDPDADSSNTAASTPLQDAPPPPQDGTPPTADPASTVQDDTGAASADTPTPAQDTGVTAAESDFDQLYGSTDGTGPAGPAPAYDPWEPYNRRMHRFNNAVDRHVAKPLAHAYVKVVPRPVRSGVSNFFSNLGQPITAINSLLQGKPKQAAHSVGRFVLNSTVGIAGLFDPATHVGLTNANEDFGQTLGVWGWKRSRYVELPFFGPRTLRDVVGMVGDAPLSPLRQVESDRIRVPIQGLQLVDLRATLMSTDALREGAEDDYSLVRDAWMQRRAYQIDGGDADTPDYLKEDQPIVPVNAMPVSGG